MNTQINNGNKLNNSKLNATKKAKLKAYYTKVYSPKGFKILSEKLGLIYYLAKTNKLLNDEETKTEIEMFYIVLQNLLMRANGIRFVDVVKNKEEILDHYHNIALNELNRRAGEVNKKMKK